MYTHIAARLHCFLLAVADNTAIRTIIVVTTLVCLAIVGVVVVTNHTIEFELCCQRSIIRLRLSTVVVATVADNWSIDVSPPLIHGAQLLR